MKIIYTIKRWRKSVPTLEDKIDTLKKPFGRATAKIAFAIIGAFAIAITSTQYGFGLYEKKTYFNTLDTMMGGLLETRFEFERVQNLCLCYLKAKETAKVSDRVTREFLILYRSRVNKMLEILKHSAKSIATAGRTFGPETMREYRNFHSTLSNYYFVDEMRCDKNLPAETTLHVYQFNMYNAAIAFGYTTLNYKSKIHTPTPANLVSAIVSQTDTRKYLDICRYDYTSDSR